MEFRSLPVGQFSHQVWCPDHSFLWDVHGGGPGEAFLALWVGSLFAPAQALIPPPLFKDAEKDGGLLTAWSGWGADAGEVTVRHCQWLNMFRAEYVASLKCCHSLP